MSTIAYENHINKSGIFVNSLSMGSGYQIQWVSSGRSVSESPGSRYIWLPESDSYDFLFVHRMDCEIRKAIKGMSKKDREAYLLEYMGLTDDDLPETDHIS